MVEALPFAMNVPASVNGDLDHAYLLEGKAFLHQGRVKVFWLLTNEQGAGWWPAAWSKAMRNRRDWEEAGPAAATRSPARPLSRSPAA